jgi:hypothetical protein
MHIGAKVPGPTPNSVTHLGAFPENRSELKRDQDFSTVEVTGKLRAMRAELGDLPDEFEGDPLPCPSCKANSPYSHLVLKQSELFNKAGLEHDHELGAGLLMIEGGDTCTGCGTRYDPWIKQRAVRAKDRIAKIKAIIYTPLEQLADVMNED